MGENNIKNIMDTTMDKLKAMVDANIITGTPMEFGDITLVPVCRVAFGVATGGSDFPSKSGAELFGGGGGAGVSVTPIGFIVIKGNDVKMLQIYKDESSLNKAIGTLPELFDKISGLFKSKEEIDIDIK